MSTEIEKAKGKDLVVDDMPDWMKNAHVEQEFDSNELQFPNLIIAQTNSKALIRGHEAFIDSLKSGEMYNSLTRQVYGESVRVIYCHKVVGYQVFKDDEFIESMTAQEFKGLRNTDFDKKKGITTPDKPGCNIKEVWRYVVTLPDYPEVPFIALNVKPGGIAEAKVWNSKMTMEAGRNIPYTGVVWELPIKAKASTTTNNMSYQIDGAGIKRVRYATKQEHELAENVRGMVRVSNVEAQLSRVSEEHISGDNDFE